MIYSIQELCPVTPVTPELDTMALKGKTGQYSSSLYRD